ncbi:MAG TPA: uroporphyrinogen decarboxylase family protein [Anaerolineae bacterium]|nr:uroporphyrinogen decarboxylase family protein [Anaerolineae bacterium]
MSWTSRERVIAAIEHREADRVPININPVLDFYLNLKRYLGLEIEEEIRASSMAEVIPHPDVLAALGVDLIAVKPGAPRGPRAALPDGAPTDGRLRFNEWGVGLREIAQPGGGRYWEPVYHPLASATIDDLERYPWPDPSAPGRGEGAEVEARRLYEDTNLALVGRFGGPIVETAIYLVGFENWLIRVLKDTEFVEALLDKITDIAMALDRVGLQATARYLQIFKISGDDFGMQTGPLYSPKTFRSLFLPRLRRRWAAARAYLDEVNPRIKILFHSCGGIRPFIPDLIDIGLQILDPVQPRAAGMASAELKQEFGDRLTFHGGVDEQQVLPFGSEQDVELEVIRCLEAFAQGGGYILAPAHYVQADVPPANLVAMCRAAHTHGRYPIRS